MTLLTEDEAKTKWCPLARASNYGDPPVSVNRIGNCPDNDCHCIASDCMAWRWRGVATPDPKIIIHWPQIDDELIAEPERPDDLRGDFVWVPVTGDGEDCEGGYWEEPSSSLAARVAAHRAKRLGFCGAFGKPS